MPLPAVDRSLRQLITASKVYFETFAKQKVRELLPPPKGLLYRRQRPIEPETVFGQTKANKQYSRFRHFGLDKVAMDFTIFAIACNIGKLYNKTHKIQQKTSSIEKYSPDTVFILIFISEKSDQYNSSSLSLTLAT